MGEDRAATRIGGGDGSTDRWSIRQKPPQIGPRNSHGISSRLKHSRVRQKQLVVARDLANVPAARLEITFEQAARGDS
jgi:hypothetical protein